MSSETKWTKGPYRVRYTKFSEVLTQNGALVAKCNRLGSLVELQATATLLASAPKLYEALERMTERFNELLEFYEAETGARSIRYTDSIDDADSALASARGEG